MINTLKPFVPIEYQSSLYKFIYYLSTINRPLINTDTIINPTKNGLEIIINYPAFSTTNYYSFNKLKIILKDYFESEIKPNQQLKFEL